MKPSSIVPALAVLAVTPAFAALDSQAALPAARHHGNLTYVTGGIGQDEARAMRREASRYPLELLFVARQGKHDDFLADMPVTIRNAQGDTVFRGRSDGPYFLAKLPAGRYTVTSRDRGERVTRHVTVKDHGTQRVVFEWKGAPSGRNA
ncbi:MAG TPA: hypothetical protein VN782_14980 [Usitatibacter sp.]|nr:hypothetical protein [Usitatibacter sp.]